MFKDSTYYAYCWVNKLYMNEKQYGIQSAHCISDMSRLPFGQEIYGEWADKHKNILIFDGTNSGTVKRVYEIIKYVAANLAMAGINIPHTIFREDEESLDGATTACGFIMPDILRRVPWEASAGNNDYESLSMFMPDVRSDEDYLTPWECSTNKYLEYIRGHQNFYMELTKRGHTPIFPERALGFYAAHFSDWMGRQRLA